MVGAKQSRPAGAFRVLGGMRMRAGAERNRMASNTGMVDWGRWGGGSLAVGKRDASMGWGTGGLASAPRFSPSMRAPARRGVAFGVRLGAEARASQRNPGLKKRTCVLFKFAPYPVLCYNRGVGFLVWFSPWEEVPMSNPLALSVISVRNFSPRTSGIVYVGRACAGWAASPLGNPFKRAAIGSKEEAIHRYRAWLRSVARRASAGEALEPAEAAAWAELLRLAKLAAAGEQLALGCWCAPAACHAEVVCDAVQWLVSSGRI